MTWPSKILLPGGKGLVVGGKFCTNAQSRCCGPCSACPSIPQTVRMTVAGLTPCPTCATFLSGAYSYTMTDFPDPNGVFDLAYQNVSGYCFWIYDRVVSGGVVQKWTNPTCSGSPYSSTSPTVMHYYFWAGPAAGASIYCNTAGFTVGDIFDNFTTLTPCLFPRTLANLNDCNDPNGNARVVPHALFYGGTVNVAAVP